jgi:hypothetical protein
MSATLADRTKLGDRLGEMIRDDALAFIMMGPPQSVFSFKQIILVSWKLNQLESTRFKLSI